MFIELLVRHTYLIFTCLSFLLATIGIFGDLFIDEPTTRIVWGDLGFYAISFWAFVTLTLWLVKKLTYKFWPTWYDKEFQTPPAHTACVSVDLLRIFFMQKSKFFTRLLAICVYRKCITRLSIFDFKISTYSKIIVISLYKYDP